MCLKNINFRTFINCFQCSKKVIKNCSIGKHNKPIKLHIRFGDYDNDILKKIILYGKNNASEIMTELGFIIGKLLLKDTRLNLKDYYLTPVPITKQKLLHRGFNQANILAESISKILSIDIMDILIKIKDTPDQVGLNFDQRLDNVKNVFKVKRQSPQNIILIDDIKTTGATLKECAYALKQQGAKNIIALTIV